MPRAEIGEAFLKGRALTIWRKALLAGPAASIDATLETLKQDDGLEACVSVAWMPASALAASPRRFVRLVGLNSSRWPRGIAEDRLLSGPYHPDGRARSASGQPRRSSGLRDHPGHHRAAKSSSRAPGATATDAFWAAAPCSPGMATSPISAATLCPMHAFSETDRLMARPQEFAPIRRRSARKAAGATGGATRSRRMMASSGPIIR